MIRSSGGKISFEVPGQREQKSAWVLTLEEVEKNHIQQVLKRTGWRIRGKNAAAASLGMKPTTLESRIKKLHIQRPGMN
jgi:transcriptional regulator with GAF, ATPase, and Fis domain